MSSGHVVALGPGPEKPPLAAWAEIGVEAILKAPNKQQFDDAFDSVFSRHISIVVNGHRVSREHYREQLRSLTSNETFAQVTFVGSVAVPENPRDPTAAGNVGLFYTATVDQPLQQSDSHNNLEKVNSITTSLNVVIIQDQAVIPPDGNTFSARRVSELNEVTMNNTSTLLPLPPA